MANVETDEVLELLYEFLDASEGERFAITNQSLLDFTRYVASQIDAGRSLKELRERARRAREFAISSAREEGSIIEVDHRKMPLVREKDAGNTVRNCDNFSAF